METEPASTHVMDNSQRNCPQDSPTKPLQIYSMIVPIHTHANHRTWVNGHKHEQPLLQEWKHLY